jgi:hypothetical protein
LAELGREPEPVSPAPAATSGERPTRDGIARALDDSTPDELRAAAAAGRLRAVDGAQAVDVAQRRSPT